MLKNVKTLKLACQQLDIFVKLEPLLSYFTVLTLFLTLLVM